MKDTTKVLTTAAALVLIAIGVGSHWFPTGSSLGMIVPAVAACLGIALFWFARKTEK
jgi:hypothetical protein